jgi:hypothetical protein
VIRAKRDVPTLMKNIPICICLLLRDGNVSYTEAIPDQRQPNGHVPAKVHRSLRETFMLLAHVGSSDTVRNKKEVLDAALIGLHIKHVSRSAVGVQCTSSCKVSLYNLNKGYSQETITSASISVEDFYTKM